MCGSLSYFSKPKMVREQKRLLNAGVRLENSGCICVPRNAFNEICRQSILALLGVMYHRTIFLLMFSPKCHHMFLWTFVCFPPGCGDSVADFWGSDAHEARLRCPYDVSGDMQEDDIPGWGLKPKSTNYPDHGHHGESFPARKNSHGRTGNFFSLSLIHNTTQSLETN